MLSDQNNSQGSPHCTSQIEISPDTTSETNYLELKLLKNYVHVVGYITVHAAFKVLYAKGDDLLQLVYTYSKDTETGNVP